MSAPVRIAWIAALAAAGVTLGATSARAVPVEAGSKGNLVIVAATNTDAQLPLGLVIHANHIPPFVTRYVPGLQYMVPGVLMPGGSGETSIVFDVSNGAAPGTNDSLVLTLQRGIDDTVLVSLPLSVVAPAVLAADVRVVFRADFTQAYYPPSGGAVTTMLDGITPIPMLDNGVPPDAAPGDRIFTGQQVFLAGSGKRHRYWFTLNGFPECDTTTAGDRRLFSVDASYDNAANPQILPPGLYALCSTTGVEPPLVRPLSTVLFQNAPNPFTSLTRIRFDLTQSGPVTLRLYDLAGRRVRSMDLGSRGPGSHVAVWDARDQNGLQLRPGTYFALLSVNGRIEGSKRMVLVR